MSEWAQEMATAEIRQAGDGAEGLGGEEAEIGLAELMEADEIAENPAETAEGLAETAAETEAFSEEESIWVFPESAAQTAAEYARSFDGWEKAADYIERHYDGDDYVPGDVIRLTTRNQALEGTQKDGVGFFRRQVELTDGLMVEGVFPEFESVCHVELGQSAKDMSLHRQFTACKEEWQDRMYDDRTLLEGISLGDMERLENVHGYAPEGFTWHHNPETGSFELVHSSDHGTGHTGGNALW